MKNIIKYILIVCFITIISLEGYFIFKQDNNLIDNKEIKEETNTNQISLINEEDKKYVGNIYDSYYENGLSIKEVIDSHSKYIQISDLKDKAIENKVNNLIKEKVEKLITKYNANIYISILSNFSNTISISFNRASNLNYVDVYKSYSSEIGEYLNIDLTTGNELKISDLFYDLNPLKSIINQMSYKEINKLIGFVCGEHGGNCENPIPDYASVENSMHRVLKKFNNFDYSFGFTDEKIYINFNNLNLVAPTINDDHNEKCEEYNGIIELDKCYNTYNTHKYEIFIDYSTRKDDLYIVIDLSKLYEVTTIYDKFKTEESIFLKNGKENKLRFGLSSNDIKEVNDALYDIQYNGYMYNYESEKIDVLNSKIQKEIDSVKKNEFNVFDISETTDNTGNFAITFGGYTYYNFYVKQYSMSKDDYLKYKNTIYSNKFKKLTNCISEQFGEICDYKQGYDFLDKYFVNDYYYFYILDENNNEYNSSDVINKEYLREFISDNWYSIGEYKDYDSLFENLYITTNDSYEFKDRLVIDFNNYNKITLKYNNEKKVLCEDFNGCDAIKDKLIK